jgi:hypothetical protein
MSKVVLGSGENVRTPVLEGRSRVFVGYFLA